MEIQQLRYFVKIAELGVITKAAKELKITQPNLTRQIKMLEQEWGWKLFRRSSKGVTLTEKGEVTFREISKLLRVIDNTITNLRRQNGRKSLNIGFSPSLSSHFLKEAISLFNQLHPNVLISLHDLSSEEMAEGILSGKLDVIIGVEYVKEWITWEKLYTIPQKVVLHQNHALAKREELSLSDLDGQKLLMFSRADYPEYWEFILTYFSNHQVNAKIAGEFDGIESLTTALHANLGLAILTESSNESLGAELLSKNITEGIPELTIGIGYSAEQAPEQYILEFIAECRRFID